MPRKRHVSGVKAVTFQAPGEVRVDDVPEPQLTAAGEALGSLQGAQAELLLVPNAELTLRRVPDGMSDDVALFAGDVMGTGYHAVVESEVEPGSSLAVLGLGPVGLCAVQAAFAEGAGRVIAIDTVDERLRMA